MTPSREDAQRYPLRKPYNRSSNGLGLLIGLILGKSISAQRSGNESNNTGRFRGHSNTSFQLFATFFHQEEWLMKISQERPEVDKEHIREILPGPEKGNTNPQPNTYYRGGNNDHINNNP